MNQHLTHGNIIRWTTGTIGVVMAAYHMWVIVTGTPEAIIFRGTHLLFALTLTFLVVRRSQTQERDAPSLLDYGLLALATAPLLYLFVFYDYVVNRIYYIDDLTWTDMAMGTILVVMILEATRRLIGWALPITALVFLAYGLFYVGVEPMRLLDQLYMTTEGIFGMPLGVSASYVMIFVLFGSFMERTGTGQLFMDFAMSLTGHTAGGPGKVSVVSSSLFGTISGSAVANVMVDGPISIPLMKRTGFRPHFAAGVEAVASTGGQIMPPIMGAAAFVMAEFMQVSYGQVIVWALIPAVLYYLACFGGVHFEAKRLGLAGMPRSELPRLSQVLRERGHLFLPVLMILMIMYSGYSAPMAALAGTLACFPVAALRASTRVNVTLRNVVEAMIDGARNALPVALACACAGIIIGVVSLTGAGIIFTQVVLHLAQSTLLLALVLTMIAGIILGMGMPTTPAYIIMTALLVPALIKLGVVEPAAHMFAFYFAILSAITPPVALATFAAAGLAKADLWKSGVASVKIGAAGFIVPFMFVYEPALLMIGDWPVIVAATITAAAGALLLASGLHGYLLRPAALWERAFLVAAAFCLIKPGLVTDLAGATLTGIVVMSQLTAGRRIDSTLGVKKSGMP
ncbi:TRAP transporter permease [Microvirga makkahensis]|uniref:TRAP transporter fused permease subunit n=1 Tax=Microvirga makkahensis TaxID=1128670 RepID=A0A7X3MVT0_9HYPH|nr:TRAP transporter permease [Microvirga makkahensis]MXQ14040.1 TRAP transporter fused permease subunit [Microvirga makkahensis]